MRRRHFGQLAIATAILLGATALTPVPVLAQGGKTVTGGFDVGPGGFPGNFNPFTATAGFTWLNTYYEPLVTNAADLSKLEAALADEYSVSDDGLTYTFKLTDATWHDGQPFTSADVKFTLEFAKNADSGSLFAARLKGIESVEAPDEKTAVVTLAAPNAGFLPILTLPSPPTRTRNVWSPRIGCRPISDARGCPSSSPTRTCCSTTPGTSPAQ